MQKLLIITNSFPPDNSVGGFRAEAWRRYLPKKDFEVKVLVTSRNQASEEQGVHSIDLGRLSVGKKDFLRIILEQIRIKNVKHIGQESLREMYSIVREIAPDKIIVTGPPFLLFHYTALVARLLNIKWVADYRDAWSTNVGFFINKRQGLKNRINRMIEGMVVGQSSFVTTASPVYAHQIRKVVKSKSLEVIYNGYFEEDFEGLIEKPSMSENQIEITYLGTLYNFQDVEKYLEGVALYQIESGKKVVTTFFGLTFQKGATERVKSTSAALKLTCKFTDKIPRKAVIEAANGADVTLLLCNAKVPQLYAKVYDYIALKKPILMVNDEPFMKSFLNGYDRLKICNTPKEIKDGLKELLHEQLISDESLYMRHTTYTRREQTLLLSDHLKKGIS